MLLSKMAFLRNTEEALTCPQNRNKVDHPLSLQFNNQIVLIDRAFLGFISWPILRLHLSTLQPTRSDEALERKV